MSIISSLLFFLCNPSMPPITEKEIQPYMAPEHIQLSFDVLFKDGVFKDAFLQKNREVLRSLGCIIYDSKWGHISVIHPALPDYIIKGDKPYQDRNWRRVFYAQEIKKAIGDNQDLCIPTEYLYHYPDRPTTPHSTNYCVISKKVAIKEGALAQFLMDRPELLKNIQTMMKNVGYWNPGIRGDILVTEEDKVIFVNTELYPDGYNIVLQSVLNLIFFRLKPRGVFVGNKLAAFVERAKNPVAKKRNMLAILGIGGASVLAVCALIKMIQH